MIRIVIIVLITSFGYINSFAQGGYTKVKIGENITAKVPSDWTLMSQAEIIDASVASTDPVAMYASQDRRANFGVTIKPTQWRQMDMGILKDFYKSNIMNLYTKVDFSKDEIITVNKKSYISFEFESFLEDDGEFSIDSKKSIKKYTYLRYHIEDGQLYVFSFNAPPNQKNQYAPMAELIMDSIGIK